MEEDATKITQFPKKKKRKEINFLRIKIFFKKKKERKKKKNEHVQKTTDHEAVGLPTG